MTGVHLMAARVEHVIVDEELVPCGHEVFRHIIRVLQITVHTEETGQTTVDRILECSAVKTLATLLAQEVLVLRLGDIGCDAKLWAFSRCTTTAASLRVNQCAYTDSGVYSLIERSKVVTTRNLTDDEEVVLPQIRRTAAGRGCPLNKAVYRHLSGLIDTNAVEIECRDSHAGELRELCHDVRIPFTQTVLYGRELRQLTLPVRVHTESFHVSILVELRRVATAVPIDVHDGPFIAPEHRHLTGLVVLVVELPAYE